ncbi:MAG: hypothetical protein O7G85_00070 [Planctomycetota bacterium]|nr:hypothetical protein [Planctomycetota bacterium]
MKQTPPHPFQVSRRPKSRARFILPIVLIGLIAAIPIVMMRSMPSDYSEAEILRSIHATALRQSEKPGVPNGGPLGPWWISASEADPISGEFRDFSITTETMIIAARMARVEIDPFEDTFVIDMEGVVMTRFKKGDDAEEYQLVDMDHFRLGPAPFGIDIRADAGRSRPDGSSRTTNTSPLAGVQISDH